MHLVYIDDTKQNGKRHKMGKLASLGAVVFPENQIKPFADAFYEAYDKFQIPHHVELKWSNHDKSDWFRAQDRTLVQTSLRESILEKAAYHEATIVVASWDLGSQVTMQGVAAEEWLIRFVFELVTILLRNSGQTGLLIFDKPGGGQADEENWVTATKSLTALGTEYVAADSIVSPVLTAHSHHHPHLQLADLVVGATTAAIAGSAYGLELIPLLKPLFATGPRGNIGGVGLKTYPDLLNNLHYWILEENELSRSGSSQTLPSKSFVRYVDNDGLEETNLSSDVAPGLGFMEA